MLISLFHQIPHSFTYFFIRPFAIGTISFAASGCITAGYASMDLLGCTIVGTITSIGGGTVRDLLIGNAPVFWASEVEYIILCLATTSITFFTWNELEKQKIVEEDGSLLWWTDTIGVGAFCVIGAQNGIRKGLNPLICIICGMFTATFGGVVRDLLCQRKPRILHSSAEIYATTALLGAGTYVFSKYIGLNPFFRIFNGVATAMGARYYASTNEIKLPLAPWYAAKKG